MKFVKTICLVSLFCLSNAFSQKEEQELNIDNVLANFKKLSDEDRLAFAVWLNEKSAFKKDSVEDFAKNKLAPILESIKDLDKQIQESKKYSESTDFNGRINSLNKVRAALVKEQNSSLKSLIDSASKRLPAKFHTKLAGKVSSDISKDKFLDMFLKHGYFNFKEAMRRSIDKGDKDTFEYLIKKNVVIDRFDENYYNKFIQMKGYKAPEVKAATGAK